MQEINFWAMISHASLPVQFVMLTLLALSVLSWMYIFQRGSIMRQALQATKKFDSVFWSGIDLLKLYEGYNRSKKQLYGTEAIFKAGFNEFVRLRKDDVLEPKVVMQGTMRAMHIAMSKEQARLQRHLNFLATVGSISPYIGLFGTVWGIMSSFQALGQVQQASLAMVAPGISEALIATAIGLFAAIPAVMAYNRYSNKLQNMMTQCDIFIEEFANVLHRKLYAVQGG